MADDRLQQQEEDIILSQKEIIERNLMVQNRLVELDLVIPKLPDRKATIKGNLTMKEYLTELKNYAEKNPSKYYLEEKERLGSKIGSEIGDEEVIGGKN